MERKAVGYTLKVVTSDNLRDYLPDLPDRVFRIALQPRRKWQKYFSRRARRAAAIALRADYIRAFLLERYGGLYVDSDAIVLEDLAPYFEDMERVGFLVMRRM